MIALVCCLTKVEPSVKRFSAVLVSSFLTCPSSFDAAGFASAVFSPFPGPFPSFELDPSLPLELDPSPFCPFPFRFGVVGGEVDPFC